MILKETFVCFVLMFGRVSAHRTVHIRTSQSELVLLRFWSYSVQIILESVQDSLRSFGPIRGLYAQQGLDRLQGNPLWCLDVHGRPIRPVDYHDPV